MLDDHAYCRAVGVMVWAMTYPDGAMKRRLTPEEAMHKAWSREPQLSEREISACLDHAQASIRAAEMCKVAPPQTTLAEILDSAGVPWRE